MGMLGLSLQELIRNLVSVVRVSHRAVMVICSQRKRGFKLGILHRWHHAVMLCRPVQPKKSQKPSFFEFSFHCSMKILHWNSEHWLQPLFASALSVFLVRRMLVVKTFLINCHNYCDHFCPNEQPDGRIWCHICDPLILIWLSVRLSTLYHLLSPQSVLE